MRVWHSKKKSTCLAELEQQLNNNTAGNTNIHNIQRMSTEPNPQKNDNLLQQFGTYLQENLNGSNDRVTNAKIFSSKRNSDGFYSESLERIGQLSQVAAATRAASDYRLSQLKPKETLKIMGIDKMIQPKKQEEFLKKNEQIQQFDGFISQQEKKTGFLNKSDKSNIFSSGLSKKSSAGNLLANVNDPRSTPQLISNGNTASLSYLHTQNSNQIPLSQLNSSSPFSNNYFTNNNLKNPGSISSKIPNSMNSSTNVSKDVFETLQKKIDMLQQSNQGSSPFKNNQNYNSESNNQDNSSQGNWNRKKSSGISLSRGKDSPQKQNKQIEQYPIHLQKHNSIISLRQNLDRKSSEKLTPTPRSHCRRSSMEDLSDISSTKLFQKTQYTSFSQQQQPIQQVKSNTQSYSKPIQSQAIQQNGINNPNTNGNIFQDKLIKTQLPFYRSNYSNSTVNDTGNNFGDSTGYPISNPIAAVNGGIIFQQQGTKRDTKASSEDLDTMSELYRPDISAIELSERIAEEHIGEIIEAGQAEDGTIDLFSDSHCQEDANNGHTFKINKYEDKHQENQINKDDNNNSSNNNNINQISRNQESLSGNKDRDRQLDASTQDFSAIQMNQEIPSKQIKTLSSIFKICNTSNLPAEYVDQLVELRDVLNMIISQNSKNGHHLHSEME